MNNERILELILAKVEKLDEKQGEMNATLAVNTEQLKEHIRRTDLLESSVSKLRSDLKPVEEHVATMQRAGWLAKLAAKIAAGVVAFVAGLLKLFGGA
jgi:uncharacterized protein (UPF0335 family)